MQLHQRINAFSALGRFLGQFASEEPAKKENVLNNDSFFSEMQQKLQTAKHHNGWFTEDNLRFTCKSWAEALTEE
ncbi:MAG TPA: acyl-CoA reductase, partial [Flavobacteriaceae bacterium]|nr:acyl-CoA reductase [Flavobacteriaceae bacterium]